jgi:hypothetical protein
VSFGPAPLLIALVVIVVLLGAPGPARRAWRRRQSRPPSSGDGEAQPPAPGRPD